MDYSILPAKMSWTIAFDGRTIGQVTSAKPKGSPAPRVRPLTKYQYIVSAANEVPTVGGAFEKFAPMAMGPTKGRRPLVVISKPYFRDPDGWKRTPSVPQEVAALIRSRFRKDFPHVNRCRDEKITQRDWNFPDAALSFPVAYESNQHAYLIEAELAAGNCGYIDDPNDPLSGPWFFVSKDRQIRHFGSFLYLLDAGDYDNDGRSEIIFGLNQPEDTDGFILFDADLNKRASLIWTYH